ncbi:MAG: hypothetical protein KIT84_44490 [Labilithrix sp.]|nr:hypothetical protein [Labilithrix sp.]MCW5818139.1 hypothetical protein [Labilithrix sp.]
MIRHRLVAASAAWLFLACGGASPEPNASPASQAPPATANAPATDADAGAAPVANSHARAGEAWPLVGQTEEEKRAQLERLEKDAGPIKSNWTPPGKRERYGHAEGLIAADYAAVRGRLADFAHYDELAGPKFKKVSLVDKSAAGSDLYFQLPIMRGAVTIWYVARFGDPRPVPGEGEVIQGEFVKGNIKGMHLVFTVRPAPEQRTILTCDLLLTLHVAAPQGEVDHALRDACGDAVRFVRSSTTQGALPPAPRSQP